MYTIRKNINMNSNVAIFIFINNSLISMNQTINEVYLTHYDLDGFLYIKYTCENTFG